MSEVKGLVCTTVNHSITKFYLRCIFPFTNLATLEHHLCYLRTLYRMTESSTLSSSSLLKGLWEAGTSTPPNNNTSSRDGTADYQSAEFDDDEREEIRLRIHLVETRLLELVEQQEQHNQASSSDSDDATFSLDSPMPAVLPIHRPHAYPCADTNRTLPVPPAQWPQAPLMLRPTPGTNMKIRGIRYAGSTEYQNFPGVCAGCILPVNSGHEPPGKSLVIDFESPLFVGTLLMRVAGAVRVVVEESAPQTIAPVVSTDYFGGKKRKFQVLIQGRFRHGDIPMSECVTGQVFERAAGKLPARMIVNALIKFVSTLAPQLEAELDGDRPRFLTPLVATAHTVLARDHVASFPPPPPPVASRSASLSENLVNFSIYAGSTTMEEDVEEPPSDHPHSVMPTVVAAAHASSAFAGPASSLPQRRAARKKAFNRVAATKAAEPCFDPDKEYTFEFFQHLLLLTDPDDFKINMGTSHSCSLQVGLARPLNGQPIKILSARRPLRGSDDNATTTTAAQQQVLWSFDVWHQALYPYATAALETSALK